MTSSRVKLQHRPFMTPIWLTAGTAGAAFLFALFMIWVWATADSTTVIVVPEVGEERAQRLARMFGAIQGAGRVDAIYASNTLGSRLTAAPLAELLHMPMSIASVSDGKALARSALKEHGSGRVLMVANPDTVPRIVAALSGIDNIPASNAQDLGIVYVVTVPRIGHANLLAFTY